MYYQCSTAQLSCYSHCGLYTEYSRQKYLSHRCQIQGLKWMEPGCPQPMHQTASPPKNAVKIIMIRYNQSHGVLLTTKFPILSSKANTTVQIEKQCSQLVYNLCLYKIKWYVNIPHEIYFATDNNSCKFESSLW